MPFGLMPGLGFNNPAQVVAQQIIIIGTKDGLFVYNGTPSTGNPPIFSISNGDTDPYGNTVTPSASASGIPILVYSGPPANGNLICSMAPATGVDEFGNAYPEGFGLTTGEIPGGLINAGSITAEQIANATITAQQIADATITAQQIADATITGTQIADATITAGNIADATITSTQIAANANILGSQIAGGTITAGNIEDATITSTQIADGSITGSNIGNATITGANIQDATITETQIADGTITTTVISDSAGITGTQIASSTITGGNIAAETITGANIAATTITGGNIASDTIEAGNIAAGTITAAQIESGIVLAGAVNGTTITGAQFVAYGSSGEILVYSGTPAKGNLIMAFSANAGTDSVGNSYPGGFNWGTWSATTGDIENHFGLDGEGNVYVADSTDNTVVFIDSSTGSMKFYGNDSSSINIIPSTSNFAQITFPSGFASEDTPGALLSQINTDFSQIYLLSPTTTGYTQEAWVAVNAQNTSGSLASCTLNVTDYENILTANQDGVTVTALGDGNTYQVGATTKVLDAAVTITSTSGQAIFPVLDTNVGTYKYEMFLHCLQGSAAVAPGIDMAFSGTFAGGAGMLESSTYGGTSSGEEIHLYPLTASTLSNSLPAYNATVNFWIRATGTMSFSTSGAIEPYGYVGTSGDSWTIAEGSFFTLIPSGVLGGS